MPKAALHSLGPEHINGPVPQFLSGATITYNPMMPITFDNYVYVDGESHYIRSEQAWQKRKGEGATLANIKPKERPKARLNEIKIWTDAKMKFFWDSKM